MKKILIGLLYFSFLHLCFAETCPSVNDIKNNNFYGWRVLNIDSGSLLSPVALEKFLSEVNYFALAEWMRDAPEGESHCYYTNLVSGKNYLGAFLAKKGL